LSPRTSIKSRRPLLLIAAALTVGALIAPAGASAGALVASAPDCAQQSLSQPFAPWLDPAQYQFAGDGGFEAGAAGWDLSAGAATTSGNEPYYIHDGGDSHSLALPSGSSATSPTVCVGLEHPTLRFVAKKTSGLLASMGVEVLFEDAVGATHSLPIGMVGGTSGWQPTAPMVVVANLLPLLPGDYTPVQFRFTALSGSFRIDDTYVDPWGKG
jgi:hypothetical protein